MKSYVNYLISSLKFKQTISFGDVPLQLSFMGFFFGKVGIQVCSFYIPQCLDFEADWDDLFV